MIDFNRPSALHAGTPSIIAIDSRGYPIGNISYLRHPDTPESAPQPMRTRRNYSVAGVPVEAFGPRELASKRADLTQIFSLSGTPLMTDSVDAGVNLAMADAASRPVWARSSEGTFTTWEYEPMTLPGRLLAVTETPAGGSTRIRERMIWGSAHEVTANLAGVITHHYDNGGMEQVEAMALTGTVTHSTRTLLREALIADWTGPASSWPMCLEGNSHATFQLSDATGATIALTNAASGVLHTRYTIAGSVANTRLTLPDASNISILNETTTNSAGQLLKRTHGNGVVESYEYDPQTQYLIGMIAMRPAGHDLGATVLQNLRYMYDPVGNVTSCENKAVATRYWRNQLVAPLNTYTYDTLNRLVSASGRELATLGSTRIMPLHNDGAWSLYTEYYTYDNSDNLEIIRHVSEPANNSWTRTITVSDRSNRGIEINSGLMPNDVDHLFTPGGAQLKLADGRALHWLPDGQLAGVVPITRAGAINDEEKYCYSGAGNRILKVSTFQTSGTVRQSRITYLTGMKWRETLSNAERVFHVAEMESGATRLIWDMTNQEVLVRMTISDRLGSIGLEFDKDAVLISQEEFYPYGGTSGYLASNEVGATEKARRYCGKERDATGLYYYGYRYYQSDCGRWLSADPAGAVDGLNLYRMVKSNPVSFSDSNGLITKGLSQTVEFHSAPLHDTSFNNIEKAKRESFFAAGLIRNPGSVSGVISGLSRKIHDIVLDAERAPEGASFISFLEKDTGGEGQYGRISGGIGAIKSVLADDAAMTPVTFAQKMLLIKSYGAYIIDHASLAPDQHRLILNGAIGEEVTSYLSKYRPDDLFEKRGRTGVISKAVRHDSGILDSETFASLSHDEKNFLLIPGLSKDRPLFRTFIHEWHEGSVVSTSPFVERTFNKDAPMIASISGSTSCIMVGSSLLAPSMGENDRESLAKSAVAFLVGGGYHSATEVLDVAYPGLRLF
ncbi:RHS repeat domain-containing protein [Pseudomonas laurylsulfatiphila]|uniref:RHS repeat domain-containing protein n=1 Tax=Pseudomonas laurylsulfatiphila TaxID=2011015 RepID=UPI003D261AA7